MEDKGYISYHAGTKLFALQYTVVLNWPQAEKNPARLSFAYEEAVKELEVLRRSAVVNQLYGGRRLAVEH